MLHNGKYTVLFSTSEQTHCALVVCNSKWLTVALHSMFWMSTQVVTMLFSCYMTGATWNCYCLGAYSVYTIQPCTSLQGHFIWSHKCVMHVCWGATCHPHSWQNDLDLLCATVVTQGWNGYLNKSAQKVDHGEVLLPLLVGLKPTSFQSQVWHSATELSPLPLASLASRHNIDYSVMNTILHEHNMNEHCEMHWLGTLANKWTHRYTYWYSATTIPTVLQHLIFAVWPSLKQWHINKCSDAMLTFNC